MEPLLHNPVYQALLSGDAHLSRGTDAVKFFDEEVSPFAGISEEYADGFKDLYYLLPAERRILYATPRCIKKPNGWHLLHEIEGLQFVFTGEVKAATHPQTLVPLDSRHVEQMVALAALTKPGPFATRTIEFGHYFGIFDNGKLVAMTGQRLHVAHYTEISAVCTHPEYLGRGFAAALMQHQLQVIISQGQTPFLHVRADNVRAIALYERLQFKRQGPMNFYFLKRA